MCIRNICLIVIGLLFSGCASIQKDWDAAEAVDNREAYLAFIEKYPSGEYTSKAEQRLETIEYEEALEKNTISGYDEYLKEYPNGSFVTEIRKLKERTEAIERKKQELRETVNNGDIDKLKQLISKDVDITDPNLMNIAVIKGFKDIVELLIDNGSKANPTKMLFLAAYNGHKDIAILLKNHGGGVREPSMIYSEFRGDKYSGGNEERDQRMINECESCLKARLPEHSRVEFILIDKADKIRLDYNRRGIIGGFETKTEMFEMIEITKNDGNVQILLGKCTFRGSFRMQIDKDSIILCPPDSKSKWLPEELGADPIFGNYRGQAV